MVCFSHLQAARSLTQQVSTVCILQSLGTAVCRGRRFYFNQQHKQKPRKVCVRDTTDLYRC